MLIFVYLLHLYVVNCTKIYVLFGPSQSGKSSFVNALSGIPDLAEEGTGSGISQTTSCKEYLVERDGEKMHILDVPGLGDNFLNTPDEEIMDQIRKQVTGHLSAMILDSGEPRKTIDGILIFESLEDDFTRVDQTLSQAQMLFGPGMDESAVVLFTKGDLEYARRADTDLSLPNCTWESKKLENKKFVTADSAVIEDNWLTLKGILQFLTPYEVANMEQVLADLRVMTRKLWANQAPEYETVRIPVKRQVQTGTKKTTTTEYKSPVKRYRTETRTERKNILVSRARSNAELTAFCLSRFQSMYNSWTASFIYDAHLAQHILYGKSRVISGIQNANYPAMLTTQFTYSLTDSSDRSSILTLPGFVESWRASCLKAIKDSGWDVDTFRTENATTTVKVPYQYREPYEVTTSTPIYTQVDDVEEKQVQKPLKKRNEFEHIASKSLAETIRENLLQK